MNKKKPLITIGITCFNAEATIKRAIKSAIKQDWPNLEVLIVNDCSTDNTKNIINRLCKINNNIKIFHNKKNLGCAQSRNILIENSKGKFIAFFDSDDFSYPNRLSLQYQRIIEYECFSKSRLIACYASGLRIYPNGYTTKINAVGSIYMREVTGLAICDFLLFNNKLKNIYYGSGTPACSLMARKDTFLKVGKFDKLLSRQEDIDFAIRLGFKGGHFIGISDKVLNQYFFEGSKKVPLIELNSSLRIIEKNSSYLKKKKIYDYIIKWTKLRYLHFSKKYFCALRLLINLFLNHPFRSLYHVFNTGFKRVLHEYKMNN